MAFFYKGQLNFYLYADFLNKHIKYTATFNKATQDRQ